MKKVTKNVLAVIGTVAIESACVIGVINTCNPKVKSPTINEEQIIFNDGKNSITVLEDGTTYFSANKSENNENQQSEQNSSNNQQSEDNTISSENESENQINEDTNNDENVVYIDENGNKIIVDENGNLVVVPNESESNSESEDSNNNLENAETSVTNPDTVVNLEIPKFFNNETDASTFMNNAYSFIKSSIFKEMNKEDKLNITKELLLLNEKNKNMFENYSINYNSYAKQLIIIYLDIQKNSN